MDASKGAFERRFFIYISGAMLLLALVLLDVHCGDASLDLFHLSEQQALIFWKLRLPRAVAAVLAGAALSLSGLQMQSIFRNPLADPHIMGVSSGASLAAALVTAALPTAMMGSLLSGLSLAAAAFIGAALVSSLIILLSSRLKGANTLLIFGVMLGYILSACTSIVEFSSSDRALRIFYNWSAGSFTSVTWGQMAVMALLLALGLLLCSLNHRGLDVLLFGDAFARSTGADVTRIRALAMISTCLLTGTVTAFCGPLGFVGIAGPHIARWIWRSSVHGHIVAASALTGACIALIADIASVIIRLPVPVGSTMAIVGIPVIIMIIMRQGRSEY